jgi:Holliday junction resolvase RusA-like endonuclease
MIFHIDQIPVAKARHRFNTRTGTAYKDPSQIEKENEVKGQIFIQMRANKYLITSKPVKVSFVFQFSNTYLKKKDKRKYYTAQRKDLDNMIKFYLDCMNRSVFMDDSQVVVLSAKKVYGPEPSVKIKIEEVKNE